jgi:hypothetical protein
MRIASGENDMMKSRQFFGVVLRAMGVWWLGDAVVGVFNVAMKLDGVPSGSQLTWQNSFMFAAAQTLVGLIMLLGADGIVRFAYRGNHDDEVERF